MSKTLGQLYHDAQWPQYDYDKADKWRNEREAAGIAAVARHVVAELLAAHVAEFHAPQPGPNAWASRPWEMSEKPVESADVTKWKTTDGGKLVPDPPKPEAGDWAMKAYVEAEEKYNAISAMNGADYAAAADAIREAAERHYGQMVESLDRQMKELEQERDAARAEAKLYESELEKTAERLQRTHKCGQYKAVGLRQVAAIAEQVCDELDAARAECERLRAASGDIERLRYIAKEKNGQRVYGRFFWRDRAEQYCRECLDGGLVVDSTTGESLPIRHDVMPRVYDVEPPTPPPAAVAGDDELAIRINGAFAMWRKDTADEREAECVAIAAIRSLFDSIRQRAESAEAALAELRAACEWHWEPSAAYRQCWKNGKKYFHSHAKGAFDHPLDAILAAHRAAKGETRP